MPLLDLKRVRSALILPVVLAGIIGFSGCSVPLAPGYQVQKESLTVRFVAGTPPHLSIRAEYQLKNVGTAPLDFIEVTAPGEKTFGRSNLRVLVANREIMAQSGSAPGESASAQPTWRIPLTPALRKKKKVNVSLEYDLAATAPTDPRIFVAENMFSLNDSGWFPEFQEPKAFFAADITRPNPVELTIQVPSNFLATASGRPLGVKKRNTETEYRFRIGAGDFDPYVLAGQYQQQIVSANGVNVAIWTFKSIPTQDAQETGTQIATTEKVYVQNLGPLPRSMKQIYDIEAPIAAHGQDVAWSRSVLPGVIFNWQSGSDKPFAGLARVFGRMDLAQTWFSHVIVPRPEAWTLDSALSLYAASSLDENVPSAMARGATMRSVLTDYDSKRSNAADKPMLSLALTDPEAQLMLAGDKIQLFFFALQDKCGQQNVTHAIAHMVYALRGQQYGYNDFRAALEQECHQDLAAFFHSWLNQTGIPADFRARYEKPQSH